MRSYGYRDCDSCFHKQLNGKTVANTCLKCSQRPDTQLEQELGEQKYFENKMEQAIELVKKSNPSLDLVAIIADPFTQKISDLQPINQDAFVYTVIFKPDINLLITQQYEDEEKKAYTDGIEIKCISVHRFFENLSTDQGLGLLQIMRENKSPYIKYFRNNEVIEHKFNSSNILKLAILVAEKIIDPVQVYNQAKYYMNTANNFIYKAIFLEKFYNYYTEGKFTLNIDQIAKKVLVDLIYKINTEDQPSEELLADLERLNRVAEDRMHTLFSRLTKEQGKIEPKNCQYNSSILPYLITLLYDIRPVDLQEFFTTLSNNSSKE